GVRNGERVTARSVRVRRDDAVRYVDVTVAPASDWPGAAALLVMEDATQRVEAEAEAARLRERLAESEAARARLRTVQEELNERGPDGPPTLVGGSQALK